MILAELPAPSPASTWQFLLVVAALSGVAVNIVTIFFLLGNRKEKREITFGIDPVSKVEFEKHVEHNTKRHGELFSAVDRAKEETAKVIDKNYRETTDQFRQINKEIGGIAADNKTQTAALQALNHKLDTISSNLLNEARARKHS